LFCTLKARLGNFSGNLFAPSVLKVLPFGLAEIRTSGSRPQLDSDLGTTKSSSGDNKQKEKFKLYQIRRIPSFQPHLVTDHICLFTPFRPCPAKRKI
jgi:hypothetical protein